MKCDMCDQGVEGILAFPFVTITRVERGEMPAIIFVDGSNSYFSANGASSGLKPIVSDNVASKFPLKSEGPVEVDGWQWFRENYSYAEKTGHVFIYARRMPLNAYIAAPVSQLEQLIGKEVSGKDLRKLFEGMPLGRNRTGKDQVTDASGSLSELELTEEVPGVARIVLGVPKQIERSYGAMDYFTILTVHYSGRLKTAEEVEKQQRPSNFMPRDPSVMRGTHGPC